ncbi:MAG: FtsX-like permease family protein [Candidatus Limnocylindria bacterium]
MAEPAAVPRQSARATSGRGARASTEHPLSLGTSLVRNPFQTLPMLLATLLAALGIATVVMLATSIARTALAPNDFLMGALLVDPRGAPIAGAEGAVRGLPRAADAFAVRTIPVKGRFLDIELPFPISFVGGGRARELLERYGDHIAEGRLPAPGTLDVALPISLARARHLGVGDAISGLAFPSPLRIVGLVDGPRWIGIGNLVDGSRITPDAVIAFPASGVDAAALEQDIRRDLGYGTRHWTADPGGSESENKYVADLALLLGFIVLVNAAVLATINGLLALFYFRQRQREFVLLSVLGWDKGALTRRALGEIATVIGLGWILGIAATWGLMRLVDGLLFQDRGITVAFYDPTPAFVTIPLVLISILISSAVVAVALRRFDPIGHLQGQ